MQDVVYDAEHTLRGYLRHSAGELVNIAGVSLVMPMDARFGGDIRQVDEWASAVAMREGYGKVKVREGAPSLSKKAYYRAGTITLPRYNKGPWAWRQSVVLHELAHHMTVGHGHDDRFADTLADLLSKYIGHEAGLAYRILLDKNGMKVGKANV